MPVKLVQKGKKAGAGKKAAHKVGPDAGVAELADAMGDLKEKMDPIKAQLEPLAKAYAALEARLLAGVDASGVEATAKHVVHGGTWDAALGAKAKKTQVTDMEKAQELLEAVEAGLFMLLAKLGIMELKQYLTPKQLELVTLTESTGKRSVKLEKVGL